MGISRRSWLAGSAALVGAGALQMGTRPARAAAPVPVTVASLLGEDKPETQMWEWFAEQVQERLPDAFRFNIVKNAALGGEKAVAEAVRLGAIQASLSTVSALAGWVPQSQVLDLPFLLRDAAHLQRVTSGATGQRLRGLFEAQQWQVPAYINYGARHLLSKKPITDVLQLQGLKMRTIQSPLHTQLWSGYGATPVAIPIPEAYNALSNGVVDAMDLTLSAYAGFKLYEVVPHVTQTAHIWAAGVLMFSRAFWQKLTPQQQEVFEQAAQEAAAYFDALIAADEATSTMQAQAAGAQISPLLGRPAWVAGARRVWATMADAVGGEQAIAEVENA